MSRIERWTRQVLEAEAAKRGVSRPDRRSRAELIAAIVRHDYATGDGVRQARKLMHGLFETASTVLPRIARRNPIGEFFQRGSATDTWEREPESEQHSFAHHKANDASAGESWQRRQTQPPSAATFTAQTLRPAGALEKQREISAADTLPLASTLETLPPASAVGAARAAGAVNTPRPASTVETLRPGGAAQTLRPIGAAGSPPLASPLEANRPSSAVTSLQGASALEASPATSAVETLRPASAAETLRPVPVLETLRPAAPANIAQASVSTDTAQPSAADTLSEFSDPDAALPSPVNAVATAAAMSGAQPSAASQITQQRRHAELTLHWQVTAQATERARALLGQRGELALRVVAVRADPQQIVHSDITDHGPVALQGEWTIVLPNSEAHCVSAVGLRHGERFVSIVHDSSRARGHATSH